jgi:large subunit ribosomal protein L47
MASSAALRPSAGAMLQQISPRARISTANALIASHQRPQHSNQVPAAGHTFSTSALLLKRHTYDGARKTRDASKQRGESALRRSGTRWRLSVSDEPLPIPVPASEIPKPETDPDHGLWGFFQNRDLVTNTPAEDARHGRSWTVNELRGKSWDDLHALWWVCVKERNRISTARWERQKSMLGFGDAEANERDKTVCASSYVSCHALPVLPTVAVVVHDDSTTTSLDMSTEDI